MAVGLLTDLTRCVGCGACERACKEINDLPDTSESSLSAATWTSLDEKGGQSIRRQCMHCLDPACVSVCPVGALQKTSTGAVIYDETKCMGCRYCMVACPFSIPKYEWASTQPRVQKCIMCYDKRVKDGGLPACVEACPAEATVFGDRDRLLNEARRRIRDQPGRYVDHIYGLKEAGGTSVLYLSAVPFAELGFPTGTDEHTYPRLTWEILEKIPNIVSTGGVAMLGLWWIVNRRERLQREEFHDEEGR